MSADFDWPEGPRLTRWALFAGGAGLGLCALGALFDADQFARSYLLGYVCWLGIALGSLAIWMLHNLTGGWWGLVLRRNLEAATRTLPLMALLFLPVALSVKTIYPWAASTPPEHFQAAYLNIPFYWWRAIGYFAAWLAMAFVFNYWSAAHDRTADPMLFQRARDFSGPALIVYGLTVTFAVVDWIMSLEPEWSSTIFAGLVGTGQLLHALAMAIAMTTWTATRPPLRDVATPAVWNDLGNLLLAFVMLWTYMSFSQLLVIWSGNLPEEISWYVSRSEGGWQWVALLLTIFYFILPFVLLLSRDIKRNPVRLRTVAVALVVMSFVHHYWLIAPAFSPRQLALHWLDLAAIIGVGGLWLATYFRQIRARQPLPLNDPLLAEAPHA